MLVEDECYIYIYIGQQRGHSQDFDADDQLLDDDDDDDDWSWT